MSVKPWFERDPARLEEESQAFESRGLAFTINQELLRDHQVVVFDGTVTVKQDPVELRVIYPSGFPWIAPEVVAKDRPLDRHANPYFHSLCVLPHPDAWSADRWGAELVERAIDLLATSAEGKEAVASREVDAPEPASTYYPYTTPPMSVIVPTDAAPSGGWGYFTTVAIKGANCFFVTAIEDPHHQDEGWRQEDIPLAHASDPIRGVWFRVPEPPPFQQTFADFSEWAREQLPDFARRMGQVKKRNKRQHGKPLSVFAVIYPNEGPRRYEYHDAWLLFFRTSSQKTIARHTVFTPAHHRARIATTKRLSDKAACLIGLGALGSPIAVELARAGIGKLVLIDDGIVECGNLVRQAYSLDDVGLPKAVALARRVALVSPITTATPFPHRLGLCDTSIAFGRDPLPVAAEHMKDCDILIAATGSTGTDYLINELAQLFGLPAVFTWVLNGAWGGRVFRATPGGPCLHCFGHQKTLPMPPEDTMPPIFPRGCGFPTFTGTGFDALSVAAAACRIVVQTLLAGDGYPPAPYNLVTVANRDTDAAATPWIQTSTIERASECTGCTR